MSFIPLSSPNITEADIEAVAAVLRTGMLVQGEQVEAFENEVGRYLGVENVIAVSNGTASLHLALVALGIGPGDEVIVPAFSYIATANVVEIVGATCVFVDIELDTFNIDVSQVEAAITSRTKAIIPVHEFGLACDITDLMKIADNHGIAVIEDAACALGAKDGEKFVGTFGNVGSFSLHPRKAITSGEGGLLTTNDPALANELRILRNHGIEVRNGKAEFVRAGFNYRMTDFQAALARGQFSRLDTMIDARNSLATVYMVNLRDIPSFELPRVPENKRHTWQTFHLRLNGNLPRDEVIRRLRDHGTSANYGAQCIPAQTYFRNKYSLDSSSLFPNALSAFQNGLAIPLYDKLTEENVIAVSKTLITIYASAS
jgi:perosamine synthetase